MVRGELEPFLARARGQGAPVARFVEREIRAYPECGVLAVTGFSVLSSDRTSLHVRPRTPDLVFFEKLAGMRSDGPIFEVPHLSSEQFISWSVASHRILASAFHHRPSMLLPASFKKRKVEAINASLRTLAEETDAPIRLLLRTRTTQAHELVEGMSHASETRQAAEDPSD